MKMNTEIRTLLIPTDFSEKAQNAVEMGAAIADRHDAKMILLHQMNHYHIIDPTGKQAIGTETLKDNIEKAQLGLELLQKYIRNKYPKIQVEICLKNEDLVNGINEVIQKEDVDLVVMGTEGIQKLKQFVLGSTSYNILSNICCSVLMVPENFRTYRFSSILFPVRVLNHLTDKFELAVTIAKKNQSKINLLGIGDENNLRELTDAYLQLKKKLYIKKADYSSEFLFTGDKANQISKFAKQEHTDLILLNYEDEESWKSFFSENFIKKIINKTEIPLLFLKPKLSRNLKNDSMNFDITMPIPG